MSLAPEKTYQDVLGDDLEAPVKAGKTAPVPHVAFARMRHMPGEEAERPLAALSAAEAEAAG